jgi:hypothetical protein
MAERFDSTRQVKENRFLVGQFVKRIKKRLPSMIISKFDPRWEGPFIVDAIGLHDSYVLRRPNGDLEPHPVNGSHLAPYISQHDLLTAESPNNLESPQGSTSIQTLSGVDVFSFTLSIIRKLPNISCILYKSW